MKFPLSKFLLSRRDARVFAEASELALLRLEQCIADQYICVPKSYDRIARWDSTAEKSHESILNNAIAELGSSNLDVDDKSLVTTTKHFTLANRSAVKF